MLKCTICVVFILLLTCVIQADDKNTLEFYFEEEQSRGSIVGQIQGEYEQIKQEGAADIFFIEANNGYVITRVVIDRESLSDEIKKNGFQFHVLLGEETKKLVIVHIVDVNDNIPKFFKKEFHLSLSESIEIKSDIAIPPAKDLDSPSNAVTIYAIVSGDLFSNFDIVTKSKTALFLHLHRQLDYEETTNLKLNISACDIDLQKCDYLILYVNIEDENDNNPSFGEDAYYVSIYENITIGSLVYRVSANDIDSGVNSEVYYSLADINDKFSINTTTGQIYIQNEVDAEKRFSYLLVPVVSDKGYPQLKSNCKVFVTVLDCNDKIPQVVVLFFMTGDYHIKENEKVGTQVANISVWDNDRDSKNNQVSLNLIEGKKYFSIRNIKHNLYGLYIKKSLDREINENVNLGIKAVDNGHPQLSSSYKSTLEIKDVNDNDPVFENSVYTATMLESSVEGSILTTVKASDKDIGRNADLFYSISPSNQWLEIDEIFGVIKLIKKIDREQFSHVKFNVRASDKGSVPRSTVCLVEVTILDVNDNPPKFQSDEISFNITENNKAGAVVGSVSAVDPDIVGSDRIEYTLEYASREFVIDSESGKITAAYSLDREVRSHYKIRIYATDRGGLKGFIDVIIYIDDVEDYPPHFEKSFFNITVHENFPIGEEVARVSAIDLDENGLKSLIYKGEQLGRMFSIDPNTGGIKLERKLKIKRQHVYLITIYVYSKKSNEKDRTSASVQINVVTANVKELVFEQSQYHFKMSENNNPHHMVGKVKAKRMISGNSYFIEYVVLKDQRYAVVEEKLFTISNDGSIFAEKSIDYESRNLFKLTITAQDTLNRMSGAATYVFIRIIDVNDNIPRFVMPHNYLSVSEGVSVGKILFSFKAIDLDSEQNAEVTYRILNQSLPFSINRNTGEIFTTGSLDYEETKSYDVTLQACDNGIPQLSSSVVIHIDVFDVNDNAPRFSSNIYDIRIKEGIKEGTTVFKLNASDPDSGVNGEFSYVMDQTYDYQHFLLLNGQLILRHDLDRETRDLYVAQIRVRDKGIPQLENHAFISFIVEDINDEPPTFEYPSYRFEILEESPPGKVGEIFAFDKDKGDNGLFTYTLLNEHKNFQIEIKQHPHKSQYQFSCLIVSLKTFDSEKDVAKYFLKINATDYGTPKLSSQIIVEIVIKNINDESPKFSRDLPYTGCVSNGAPKGQKITALHAVDTDAVPLKITYKIIDFENSDSDALKFFAIDLINGTVYTKTNLQTTAPKFDLVVVVQEMSRNTSLCNIQKLVIFVIPSTPLKFFKESCIVLTLPEDQKLGNIRLPLSHKRSFYVSSYSLKQFKRNPFKIRPATGLLQLVQQLNYRINKFYQLIVSAEGNIEARENQPIVDTFFVNVLVMPTNRHVPFYPSNPETFTVLENEKSIVKVGTLKRAIDGDTDMEASCLFTIVESSPNKLPIQIIPPWSRNVYVITPLDREQTKQYDLKVKIIDLAVDIRKRLSNTFTMSLFVQDVNDNAPVFKSANFAYVSEYQAMGSTIMNIIAEDPDIGETHTDIGFTIINGNEKGMFKLEFSTGILTVNRVPVDIFEQKEYRLNVMAKEIRIADSVPYIESLNSTKVFKIIVLDVNDKPPRFLQSVYSASIKEGQPVNTEILRLNYTDGDLDEKYRKVEYELTDHKELFQVDAKTGVLTSLKVFDRESDELFILNVVVKNTAPPQGRDTCKINVAIEDVNDNAPAFSDGPHIRIKILENSPPSIIHKFVVTDNDSGINAQNTFKLKITKGAKKFRLNSSTGELHLVKPLDRERRNSYYFAVEAQNVNPPYMKAEQNVTIIVLDENDERPVFTERVYESHLNEIHTQKKSSILTVEAIDRDEGANALIMYSIEQSNTSDKIEHFEINADTGKITCVLPVDYEKKKLYHFKVRANGVGNHYDEADVVIHIMDSNDNRPVFKKTVYEVELNEIRLFMLVVVVKAYDADEDGRQKVTYKLHPPSEQFEVDRLTGEIRLMRTDIMFGQYHLNVRATDKGVPALESNAKVFITIGSPKTSVLRFVNSTVVFSMKENPKPNKILGKLVAVSSGKSPVTYSITDASNPYNAFRISKYTGIVSVSNHSVVDYEKYHDFLLGVIASVKTKDGSYVSSYLAVVVNLTDVNDNIPLILPHRGKFVYAEREITGPTYFLYYHVQDEDSIDEGKLKIEIIAGNEEQVFRIMPESFVMYIDKSIDYEKYKEFNLVVQVRDSANHHNESYLNIKVEDINDNPPTFDNLTPLEVSEATERGTIVKNITVFDIDGNSFQRYNVVSSPYFSIDTYLGSLMLEKRLDYEHEQQVKVNISVYDGMFTVYGTLIVNVIDANDNAPMFTKLNYVIPIKSKMKKGAYVTKIIATDRDSGLNGLVKYKIFPPSDEFSIEQDTGVIFANKDTEFQPQIDSFPLGVVAFDGGVNSRRSSVTLHLSVDGVQDTFAPEFLQRYYELSVREGSLIRSVVAIVGAFLPKAFQPVMTYRIMQGNINDAFAVDPIHGTVTINNVLDRETLDVYALEIWANMQESNVSAKCTMVIQIEDANDNSPIFEQSSYNITVVEGSKPGLSLITLHANDADDPNTKNGKVIYEIHSGQDDYEWLSIDRDTGQVKVKRTLDREMRSRIQLTIKASDYNGVGSNNDFASLNVTITDINDNTPQFIVDLPNLYELEVAENQPPETLVFKAHAFDPDEGPNGRISFRILNSSQPTPFMMKDSDSGWVYTSSVLDYEKFSLYNLTVLAQDHGTPQRSASFEYRIAVTDVNEYKPKFLKSEYSFLVAANMEVNTVVGKVSAKDKDKGKAGEIRYSFKNDVKEFSVEEKSGIIKVKDDLRLHETVRYRRDLQSRISNIGEKQFVIKADNFDNSTLCDYVTVTIKINYSCPYCIVRTAVPLDQDDSVNSSTTIIVMASIGVCFSILFVACCFMYCRRNKRTCLQKPNSDLLFSDRNIVMDSCLMEREYLTGGTTSCGNNRIQNRMYTEFMTKEVSQESSGTENIQESSGTVRSVSVIDKASTFSFGIYHEQEIPESQAQPFNDGFPHMGLKDLEGRNNLFGYPVARKGLKPASLISRSTQESSLYSMPSSRLANNNRNKPFAIRNLTVSHESLKDFQEEGGGEAAGGMDVGNLLYAKLADVNADEEEVVLDRVRPFQEEGGLSHLGSLSTIMCEDEEIDPSYNFSFSNSWKNQCNELSPLFANPLNNTNTNCMTPFSQRHTQKTCDIPLINKSAPNSYRQNSDILSPVNANPTNFNAQPSTIIKSPSTSSIGNTAAFIPGLSPAKSFEITYPALLERSTSVASQLSKITLSDINISDEDEL